MIDSISDDGEASRDGFLFLRVYIALEYPIGGVFFLFCGTSCGCIKKMVSVPFTLPVRPSHILSNSFLEELLHSFV